MEEPCVTDSSIRHVVEKIVCKRKNNATNCAIATTIGNVKKKGFFWGTIYVLATKQMENTLIVSGCVPRKETSGLSFCIDSSKESFA